MSNKKPISKINDEQLNYQLNAIKAHIRRTRKYGGDTQDAEVELCYLEREYEHREISKKIHEPYMKKIIRQAKKQFANEEESINAYMRFGMKAVELNDSTSQE